MPLLDAHSPCSWWRPRPTIRAGQGQPVCKVQRQAELRSRGLSRSLHTPKALGPVPQSCPHAFLKTSFPMTDSLLLQGAQESFCYLLPGQLLQAQLETGETAQMQTRKLARYIKSKCKTRKLPVTGRREAEAEWICKTMLLLLGSAEPSLQCPSSLQRGAGRDSLAFSHCMWLFPA